MSGVFTKILSLPIHFPLVRGMLSYAIIWPTCSIVQEYIEHGTKLSNANWARAARFSFFGTFFMAPVFYGWMKYSSRFFKRKDLMTAISRAAVEQVSYSPLAMAYFFFGMSMLEGKPYKVCLSEVREKFWPTYKMGVVFWPTAQTLNFYFVSEKNRIVFVSAASFVWTVYLAHVKGKEQKNEDTYSGLDAEPLIIEHKTDYKTEAEDESELDKTHLMGGENVVPSMRPESPVVEMKGDSDNVSENPVFTMENVADETKPDLVSHLIESENVVPGLRADSPVVEMKRDVDNFSENPVLVVGDAADKKNLDLVSDEHPVSPLSIESLSEPNKTNDSLDDESSLPVENLSEPNKINDSLDDGPENVDVADRQIT